MFLWNLFRVWNTTTLLCSCLWYIDMNQEEYEEEDWVIDKAVKKRKNLYVRK